MRRVTKERRKAFDLGPIIQDMNAQERRHEQELAALRAQVEELRGLVDDAHAERARLFARATRADAERDEARGRCERLEWLLECGTAYWLWNGNDDAEDELEASYRNALAECGEG